MERTKMTNAEKICEIAQSEYVWNLFVQSGLFIKSEPTPDVLKRAQMMLEHKLGRLPEGHFNRERMEKALYQLEIRSKRLRCHKCDSRP
jgi:hypothetical protein